MSCNFEILNTMSIHLEEQNFEDYWVKNFVENTDKFNRIYHIASSSQIDEKYCNHLLGGGDVCFPHNPSRNNLNYFFKFCKPSLDKEAKLSDISDYPIRRPMDELTTGFFYDITLPKIPVKITGIDIVNNKRKHFEITDYIIEYRTIQYQMDEWQNFTENGEVKMFKGGDFLDGGKRHGVYHHLSIKPGLVATKIRIRLKLRGYPHDLKIAVYGCHDEESYEGMQRNFGKILEGDSGRSDHTKIKEINMWYPTSFEFGCPIFDFENGLLTNWTIEGDAFQQQPTYKDSRFMRERRERTGFRGNWWLSSIELHPNDDANYNKTLDLSLQGTITSPLFTINSTGITYLLGGKGDVGFQLLVHGRIAKFFYIPPGVEFLTLERDILYVGDLINQKAAVRLIDYSPVGYVMFDDLRFVDRCCDECSEPMGMTSGEIKDSQISGKKPVEKRFRHLVKPYKELLRNPSFLPKHGRVTFDQNKKEIFKINLEPRHLLDKWHVNPAAYLAISLKTTYLVDGWATQGLRERGVETCSVEYYSVRYNVDGTSWRYVSAKMQTGEKHTLSPVTAMFKHRKSLIHRKWLDPRLYMKTVQFVIHSAWGKDMACLRVELYGCPLYKERKDQMGTLEIDPRRATYLQKIQHENTNYKLHVISVASIHILPSQTPLVLKCLEDGNLLLNLDLNFFWYEHVYNNKLRLVRNNNNLPVHLARGFRMKNYQCDVFQADDTNYVLFTTEYLLINKNYKEVVTFFTQDANVAYRGGRLVHDNPAVFYSRLSGYVYFSINFVNLVYPTLVDLKTTYCPQEKAIHRPYDGYEELCSNEDDELTLEEVAKCVQKGMDKGYLYYLTSRHYVYGGPSVSKWYRRLDNDDCQYIRSRYHKEGGAPCNICSNVKKHEDEFESPKFYTIKHASEFSSLEITLKVNNNKIFYKKYLLRENESQSKIVRNDLFNGVKYRDCVTPPEKNKMFGDCFYFLTPYVTDKNRFDIISFVYAFRSPMTINMPPKYPQIHLEARYSKGDKHVTLNRPITLKHASAPVVTLNENIGVCAGESLEISPHLEISDPTFNGYRMLKYIWRRVFLRTMDKEESYEYIPRIGMIKVSIVHQLERLFIYPASVEHEGVYEVEVITPIGSAKARTYITVYSDFPKITYYLPSPHRVYSGETDIIYIKTNTDAHIKRIDWWFEGKLIKESQDYSFIDNINGQPHQMKRLLLKNVDNNLRLSGNYRVELVGEFCSFPHTISVIVHNRPQIALMPYLGGRNYMVVKENSTLVITGVVFGGYPPIKESEMSWYKGPNLLVHTPAGHTQIKTHLSENNKWSVKLTIYPVDRYDEGIYQFVVKRENHNSSNTITRKVLFEKYYERFLQQNQTQTNRKTDRVSNSTKPCRLSIWLLLVFTWIFSLSIVNP